MLALPSCAPIAQAQLWSGRRQSLLPCLHRSPQAESSVRSDTPQVSTQACDHCTGQSGCSSSLPFLIHLRVGLDLIWYFLASLGTTSTLILTDLKFVRSTSCCAALLYSGSRWSLAASLASAQTHRQHKVHAQSRSFRTEVDQQELGGGDQVLELLNVVDNIHAVFDMEVHG